jgi:hypothetical protein
LPMSSGAFWGRIEMINVIIPVYDNPDTLDALMEPVVRQPVFRSGRTLISDDASTDQVGRTGRGLDREIQRYFVAYKPPHPSGHGVAPGARR